MAASMGRSMNILGFIPCPPFLLCVFTGSYRHIAHGHTVAQQAGPFGDNHVACCQARFHDVFLSVVDAEHCNLCGFRFPVHDLVHEYLVLQLVSGGLRDDDASLLLVWKPYITCSPAAQNVIRIRENSP